MELQQLRLFVASAREGGFSQAARQEYLSHSTVSRAISELEQELETEIFIRGNRGLKLTAAGEILLTEAEKLLSAADALKEKLHADAVEK